MTSVEIPDVKAIRRGLRMSQGSFSVAYRIPLATLRNWEQGRRQPEAPAAAYLLANLKAPPQGNQGSRYSPVIATAPGR